MQLYITTYNKEDIFPCFKRFINQLLLLAVFLCIRYLGSQDNKFIFSTCSWIQSASTSWSKATETQIAKANLTINFWVAVPMAPKTFCCTQCCLLICSQRKAGISTARAVDSGHPQVTVTPLTKHVLPHHAENPDVVSVWIPRQYFQGQICLAS